MNTYDSTPTVESPSSPGGSSGSGDSNIGVDDDEVIDYSHVYNDSDKSDNLALHLEDPPKKDWVPIIIISTLIGFIVIGLVLAYIVGR